MLKPTVATPTSAKVMLARPTTSRSVVVVRAPTLRLRLTSRSSAMNTSPWNVERPVNVEAPVTDRSVITPMLASRFSTCRSVTMPVLM